MASLVLASAIPYRRLSLADIDAVVSARLGPTRIQENAQPPASIAKWRCTCEAHSRLEYDLDRTLL